jgi:uncharacterized alkaline shock family protein YloU
MSDVVNSTFGRPTYESYETPGGTAEPGTPDLAAPSETMDADVVESDQAETAQVAAEDSDVADEETEGNEAVSAGDSAEDTGDEFTETADTGFDAAESDDAPVAAVASTEEAEPATEARPAAGTRGSTTVSDGVVTKIVTRVARKPEGVHSLADEDIAVEIDGDVVTIQASLVVEFGHAVKALAEQLRIDVIEAVEGFLGLDVAAVDVHVADIHFPDAD